MTNQEFLRHVLTERIELLLTGRGQECAAPEPEEIDGILGTLKADDKEKLNCWLNQLADAEADAHRQAYLDGLKDGIYLSAMIWKHVLKD